MSAARRKEGATTASTLARMFWRRVAQSPIVDAARSIRGIVFLVLVARFPVQRDATNSRNAWPVCVAFRARSCGELCATTLPPRWWAAK